MKTKYIKIDPKYQLEGKEYIQMHPIMIKNRVEQRNDFPDLEWVEEVPDREEEMREMLEECRLQLEFLNGIQDRGTTNNILNRLTTLLNELKQ